MATETSRTPNAHHLLFFRRRRQILREAFQFNLPPLRRSFLRLIASSLNQGSLQNVVRFIAPVPTLAPLNRALEFERHAVHRIGCKLKLIAIKLARLKKVVQKYSAIALRIAIARNKTSNPSLPLNGYLHEFAFLQKGIHAGVICPSAGFGQVRPGPRLRSGADTTEKHTGENDETPDLPYGEAKYWHATSKPPVYKAIKVAWCEC